MDANIGRFLSTTLHYTLRLAEQHTALLEAAIHAQQGNTSSSGGGESVGKGSSSSSRGGSRGASKGSSGRKRSSKQQGGAAAAAATTADAAAKVSAHTAAVHGTVDILFKSCMPATAVLARALEQRWLECGITGPRSHSCSG
jgi:hypothetical protein